MRAKCKKHKCASEKQLRQSEHMFTKMLRSDATINQNFRCIYCRCVMLLGTATAEHAVPRSRGGHTDRKNIKGACGPCNVAKSNGTEAWFRRVLHAGELPKNDPALLSAYIRFRINSRVERAEKKIRRAVGMPVA